MNRAFLSFVLLGILLAEAACHPRPVEDLALADVALRAAQKVKADALAPDAYRKAENFYLRAKRDYKDGYFDSAKNYAEQARAYAEQAEFKSLLKQSQIKAKPDDDQPPPPPPGGGDGALPPPGNSMGPPPPEGNP